MTREINKGKKLKSKWVYKIKNFLNKQRYNK